MEKDDTTQPSPADDAGQPRANEDGPTAEGPATDPDPQAGPGPQAGPAPTGSYAPGPPQPPYGDYRHAPRLTRRTHDKVIGGVGGGVADYFGIDPLLVRLAFVGLALIGGGGILLYVLGWIFIPARGMGESGGGVARRSDVGTWLGVGLITIAALVFVNGFGGGALLGPVEHLFFALPLIGLGIFLLRKEPTPPPIAAPPPQAYPSYAAPYGQTTAQTSYGGGAAYTAPPTAPPRYTPPYPAPPPGYAPAPEPAKPRERSRLGVVTMAAVLLTVGGAALLNALGLTSFDGGQLGALAFFVLGAGLVVGAWWGRARWLIPVGLLMLPFVAFFSLIDLSNVELRGQVGRTHSVPLTQAEIDDGYQVLAGQTTIDMGEFEFARGETASLAVEMAMGQTEILVPEGVYVDVRANVGAGEITFFGTTRQGEGVSVVETDGDPDSEARLTLDMDGGFGQVEVIRTPAPPSFEAQETPRTPDKNKSRERDKRERP